MSIITSTVEVSGVYEILSGSTFTIANNDPALLVHAGGNVTGDGGSSKDIRFSDNTGFTLVKLDSPNAVISVSNAVFADNTVTENGRMLFNQDGNWTFTTVTIENNHAADGITYSRLFLNTGYLYWNDVVAKNNTMVGGDGGGVLFNTLSATLTESDGGTLLFQNNTAQLGGVIMNQSGTLTQTGGTFSGNRSNIHGGAVFNRGTASFTNTKFFGNTSTTTLGGAIFNNSDAVLTLAGSTFSGNGAASQGGALYQNGNATITNTVFDANNAVEGGAIYHDKTGTYTNLLMLNNTATANGGAIFSCDATDEFTLTGGTLSGNHANKGGAIYNNGIATLNGGTVSENSSVSSGGAILNARTLTINDGLYLHNSNSDEGGAIYNTSSATLTETADGMLLFQNNTANFGAAIFNEGGVVTQTGGTFSANSSVAHGGAVFNRGTASFTDTKFFGNTSTTTVGGAIFNTSDLTLSGSTFSGNGAAGQGGAIYQNGTANITDTVFDGNRGTDGAAICNDKSTACVNTAFLNNIASGNGGALYNYEAGDTLTITGGTASGNQAAAGGAIYVAAGSVTVNGGTMEANTALGNGGAIFVNGAGDLTVGANPDLTAIFAKNRASNGGAIYANGTYSLSHAALTGNTATSQGGALFNNFNGGTAVVSDVLFSGNFASEGGAIFNEKTLSLNNALLTGNRSVNNGGAVFNCDPGDTVLVSGGTFANNFAGSVGGGIFTNGITSFTDTVFSGNTAAAGIGGAIYNTGNGNLTLNGAKFLTATDSVYNDGSLTISGGTLVFNAAVTGSGNITVSADSTLVFGNSVSINNNTFTNNAAITIDASNVTDSGILVYNYSGSGSYKLSDNSYDRALSVVDGNLYLTVEDKEPVIAANAAWTENDYPSELIVNGVKIADLTWGKNAFSSVESGLSRLSVAGTIYLSGNLTGADADYCGGRAICIYDAAADNDHVQMANHSPDVTLENVTTVNNAYFTYGKFTRGVVISADALKCGRDAHIFVDGTSVNGNVTVNIDNSSVTGYFFALGLATEITGTSTINLRGSTFGSGAGDKIALSSTSSATIGDVIYNLSDSLVNGIFRGTGSDKSGGVNVTNITMNAESSRIYQIVGGAGNNVTGNLTINLSGNTVTDGVIAGININGTKTLNLAGTNLIGGTIAGFNTVEIKSGATLLYSGAGLDMNSITVNGTFAIDGAHHTAGVSYTDYTNVNGKITAVNGARLDGNRAYYYNVVDSTISGETGTVISVKVDGVDTAVICGKNAFATLGDAMSNNQGGILLNSGNYVGSQYANGRHFELVGGSVGAKQYFHGGAAEGNDAFTGNVSVTGTAVAGKGILGGGRVAEAGNYTGAGTSLVVSATGDTLALERLAGGALVSSTASSATAITASFNSALTVTSKDVQADLAMGGSIVSGYANFTQTGNNLLTITDGTFNTVMGGNYIGYAYASVAVAGTTGVVINGGTFTGNIFGGNVALNKKVEDLSMDVTGTSVTIDASNKILFGENCSITAGNSHCTADKTIGSATVKLTGDADNMVGFQGTIWGDCGGAKAYTDGSWADHVAGKSSLVLEDFTGTLNASRIVCFDTWESIGDTAVSFSGNLNVSGVSNWDIQYSGQSDAAITFEGWGTKGDFKDDTFKLTFEDVTALSGDSWVVMQSKTQNALATNFANFGTVTLFGEEASKSTAMTTLGNDFESSAALEAIGAGDYCWISDSYKLSYQKNSDYYQIVVSKLA